MGDEQHRGLPFQLVYRPRKALSRGAVEVAGCLIENQDLGPLEQRAGDGQTLFFGHRKARAVFADPGLIAFGSCSMVSWISASLQPG